jgi:hypothetical protein
MRLKFRPPQTCSYCGQPEVRFAIAFAPLEILLSMIFRPYRCLRCDRRYWCVRGAKA